MSEELIHCMHPMRIEQLNHFNGLWTIATCPLCGKSFEDVAIVLIRKELEDERRQED